MYAQIATAVIIVVVVADLTFGAAAASSANPSSLDVAEAVNH